MIFVPNDSKNELFHSIHRIFFLVLFNFATHIQFIFDYNRLWVPFFAVFFRFLFVIFKFTMRSLISWLFFSSKMRDTKLNQRHLHFKRRRTKNVAMSLRDTYGIWMMDHSSDWMSNKHIQIINTAVVVCTKSNDICISHNNAQISILFFRFLHNK